MSISKKFLPLILAFPFTMAQASTTINFDTLKPLANYSPIPAGFGSTADVSVTYKTLDTNGTLAFSDVLFWNSGYANLNTAAFPHYNGGLLDITLTAVNPNNNRVVPRAKINHFNVF